LLSSLSLAKKQLCLDFNDKSELHENEIYEILLLMVGSAVEESQLKQIAKRVLLETTGGMRHKIEPEDLMRALDMEIVGVKMSAGY
jgi:hypothetical protein